MSDDPKFIIEPCDNIELGTWCSVCGEPVEAYGGEVYNDPVLLPCGHHTDQVIQETIDSEGHKKQRYMILPWQRPHPTG